MKNCVFCSIENDLEQKIILSNHYCMFIQKPQEVLIGSGVIVPKEHRKTVFDLSEDEWNATFKLLQEVKVYLDNKHKPEGYNIGWNVGKIGGQHIFHAHLHIIPRYVDEPMSGKGIRYWLKQPQNKRCQFKLGLMEKMLKKSFPIFQNQSSMLMVLRQAEYLK